MTDTERERIKAICEVAHVKDIGELSDGFHTFNGLYEQRMILFAALIKAYKGRAWKSYRHEDGEYCFGGGWFIVGIDTPEGSYTYHYENKYWDMFDCVDLPRGKHWDGHTEADAETRLMSLPTVQLGTNLAEVGTDVPGIYVGELISRQAAMERLMAQNVIMDGSEYHNGFNAGVNRAQEVIRNLPPVQPKQTNCEYCHTDRDGYILPLEKNCHAYIRFGMHGWVIELKAKGWRGEAKINYCPICGRRLANG